VLKRDVKLAQIVAGDVVSVIRPANGLTCINGVFDLLNIHTVYLLRGARRFGLGAFFPPMGEDLG
jgi:hypothetical protein